MDNDQLGQLDSDIKGLMDALEGRIGNSDLSSARRNHYAGEYQLAIELLLAVVVKEELRLTPTESETLRDLAVRARADTEFLAPFMAKFGM